MSRLRDRITRGATGESSASAYTGMYPDLTVVGLNNGPTDIPLTRIQIFPGITSMEDTQPLITADGAPVAATMRGSWGQLYAAGRP